MTNNVYEGRVIRYSKKGGAFYVQCGSQELQAQTADWPVPPGVGDMISFVREVSGEKTYIRPAPETAAADARAFEPGACMGDKTVEPLPRASAIHAPLDEVIKLSWRDVFVPAWRWIRGLFSRGLKARVDARS